MLEGEGLEEVESFRYLGSILDTPGRTDANVKTRISKAGLAFHILRNVWKSRIVGKTTKIRMFNINVKSVLLHCIRIRNMANEQDHTEKDADFCKSVPAETIRNTVDG